MHLRFQVINSIVKGQQIKWREEDSRLNLYILLISTKTRDEKTEEFISVLVLILASGIWVNWETFSTAVHEMDWQRITSYGLTPPASAMKPRPKQITSCKIARLNILYNYQ